MPPTILLDLASRVAEINQVSTMLAQPQEAIMAPTITRADRPYNDLTTVELCEAIAEIDPVAVLEAQLRLAHSTTLRPHNRRKLQQAIADLLAATKPEPAPVVEPEPVEVDPIVLAKREAAKRLKALEAFSVVRTCRVNKAIAVYGADAIADLSDEDFLAVADTKVTALA